MSRQIEKKTWAHSKVVQIEYWIHALLSRSRMLPIEIGKPRKEVFLVEIEPGVNSKTLFRGDDACKIRKLP
jgi:hypothetical protein